MKFPFMAPFHCLHAGGRLIIRLLLVCMLYGCGGHPSAQDSRPGGLPHFSNTADTVRGGTALPSRGELRMAVIFARFSGDARPHSLWPERPDPEHPEVVPEWMRHFIDSPEADRFFPGTAYENLTHYFHTASRGQLRLVGDVFHVEIPDSFRGRSFREANQAALTQLFGRQHPDGRRTSGSAGIPAAAYDQWRPLHLSALVPLQKQQHLQEADGIFDYALVIYRHRRGWEHPFGAGWNAIAGLGPGRFALGDSTLVYGGGRRVSGATALFTNPKRTAEFVYHEIAHHLLGPAHPYQGGSGAHPAYWGLFNSYLSNQSVNAWERETLGWGQMQRIRFSAAQDDALPDPITLQLGDFMTRGDAAAFEIPGQNGQLMIFEYRQKKQRADGAGSSFDAATLNEADKGLFIYTLRPPYHSGKQNIRTYPADGHHSWSVSGWSEACGPGNPQPVLRQEAGHPQGISYRDVFMIKPDSSAGDAQPYSLFIRHDAPESCRSYTRGEYFNTAFGPQSTSKKRWFSPFTNPASLLADGTYSGISAYIHGIDSGAMEVSFSASPFSVRELEIQQDLFFYELPGISEAGRILIPEGINMQLGPEVRLHLSAEITLDIQGRIVTAGGSIIRGKHGLHSLRELLEIPVYELPESIAGPYRASF